ncbi:MULTISPECIES: LysR family transcriptional regulator [unclassified Ruegeria]|uniref:LysR family transcriptional regulator n=1 Tax=unclassified Ruegeria TaxID=2625375 RepID=UPI001488EAB9|nr:MULTISPECIES: LysR family transcriptional regulator [unclassified Ruegeria]NOD46916.1 LysR family transcriptional regulator [Ruegeria sp. HKCCD5849]NOD51239.1 LysR family transcriptional regulator [Ruegeria sp. HKCCD5851]NOD68058.1 LysR family transcriptional regulator [Ruegeria sp. HKCCD7303]
MVMKGLTLRGLEVFEALARTGSVAQAAEITGLSQPSVSQQLRNLEKALGTDLVDHGRRPMRLTQAGRSFLARAEAVLAELQVAQSELSVMELGHLTTLSIGLIDDFDNDLTPRLATLLADSLTRSKFKLITLSSLDLFEALAEQRLHMAITAHSGEALEGVIEYPLVRDPFILVAPKGSGAVEAVQESLPFLRYAREQLISRQIEAHMARDGKEFEERFEIGSHMALMAMVARGLGWAITTPLGFMRAARFHDGLEAHPAPFGDFSRTISLLARTDWSDQVPQEVAGMTRRLMQNQIIEPALNKLPWLNGQLKVIGG